MLLIIFILSAGLTNGGPLKQQITRNSSDENSVDWWPTLQHDPQHSGHSTAIGPETNNTLWIINRFDSFSSPVIVNDRVYASDGWDMVCFDSDTGEELWNFTTGWWGVSSPTVYDGNVYFRSCDDYLYCVNAVSGELIWKFRVRRCDILIAPLVAHDRVYGYGYFGIHKATFYCLDAVTGETIWMNNVTEAFGLAAFWNDTIYVTTAAEEGDNVFCLDAESGEELWSVHLTDEGVYCVPTVVDGKIYVGGLEDGKVYCVNASTGQEVWQYSTGNAFNICSSPAVAYGNIYFGSNDQNVYCLNADNGTEQWIYTTARGTGSCPAVVDGKVYIGSDKVYCLDAFDGTLIWKYVPDLDAYTSPAVADGKVCIAACDNNLYCFADPLLSIGEINSIFGKVSVELMNPGVDPALNITYNITVNGGLFGNINLQNNGSITTLNPDESIMISTEKPVFGIGNILITIQVDATNENPVSKQINGFIIGPFILL